MQIASAFSVAIHILLMAEYYRDERRVTSESISESAGTHAVVIRRIMLRLRDAGLLAVSPGVGGIRLAARPAEISLLDIYEAVRAPKAKLLFRIHRDSSPLCPVGGNIIPLLSGYFGDAQKALEARLDSVTVQDLLADLSRLVQRKGPAERG